MCTAIALKLCTWLYMYELQIKFEDGCYRPFFRRVMPLKGFYSFPDFFFSLLTYIHLIFGTLLCHTKIQIRFVFGSDPLIFHEVMALGLREKITNCQFYALFIRSAYRYSFDIWYSGFAIPRYRLSLSLALIH
jgi:hypothetical protein